MAIRYSGDVEVRMTQKGGRVFRVVVRTPRDGWSGDLSDKMFRGKAYGVSPEDYDHVALVVLTALDRKNPGKVPAERDARGGVAIRRVFQAPCPVRTGRG